MHRTLSHRREPPKLRAHNGTDIILRLPMGKRIRDIRWLAVWCRRFTVRILCLFGFVFYDSANHVHHQPSQYYFQYNFDSVFLRLTTKCGSGFLWKPFVPVHYMLYTKTQKVWVHFGRHIDNDLCYMLYIECGVFVCCWRTRLESGEIRVRKRQRKSEKRKRGV